MAFGIIRNMLNGFLEMDNRLLKYRESRVLKRL